MKILAINPGSTSTKIAVYDGDDKIFEKTIRHSTKELNQFPTIFSQMSFRKEIILSELRNQRIRISDMAAVVGRGGLLKPMVSGTYAVNEAMVEDLRLGVQGQHASNLGGILAKDIAEEYNIPSFIVDPVVVDELQEVARISGLPEIKRTSIFHALNQKAVARRYANEIGKPYDELNLIVAHLGGGVTVGAHNNGRVIDVTNAFTGEGAFSPDGAGTLPIKDVINMCFDGKHSQEEMKKLIRGNGGFKSYLGTVDMIEIDNMRENGDAKAKGLMNAFVYQISKEIGAMACVLSGNKIDQIILTGGIAYDKYIVDQIKEKVSFIAPVTVYPGEDEMYALVQGAARVLNGEEEVKVY